MSETEKRLEMRLKMMQKAREMSRRGPTKIKDQVRKSNESRRLGNFLNMWRAKRKNALREFDRK
jgi:hypothetical protein